MLPTLPRTKSVCEGVTCNLNLEGERFSFPQAVLELDGVGAAVGELSCSNEQLGGTIFSVDRSPV